MANISKINVSGSDYNIKDSNARDHIIDKSNPHKVTKEQVGLGNVDNMSIGTIIENVIGSLTSETIKKILGFIPANEDDLQTKIDKTVKYDESNAVVNFKNGIKINNASIKEDNDIITFS